MSKLTKATTETAMTEIVDRVRMNGALSNTELAELLWNSFRRIRQLENALLAQVEEKRAIDAERMARVAEKREVESNAMRVIREEQDRQQAERERIAAADGFIAALDAELLKEEAAPARQQATTVAKAPPAPAAPQPIKACEPARPQQSATSQAAAALRNQVNATPARTPNTRGAFTGGMQRNSFGG